jgi:hypothetical protein
MTVVRQVARVLPGHRVEIVAPELAEGDLVDVIVLPHAVPTKAGQSVIEFLDTLPDGPRAFATWEEYEQHLRDQKLAWT